MFKLSVCLLLVLGASFFMPVVSAQSGTEQTVQSEEAIALDDQLHKEQKEYDERFKAFRRSLRHTYPSGEDRIAAMERWEEEHKAWKEDWERRSKHLDTIWNWGPEGKEALTGTPARVIDTTTASGKVAAAIRRIRKEEKGTGRASQKIARWMKDNPQIAYEIEDKIRAAHGLDFDMPKPEVDAAKEAATDADDSDSVIEA